jgi:hypothetical protein
LRSAKGKTLASLEQMAGLSPGQNSRPDSIGANGHQVVGMEGEGKDTRRSQGTIIVELALESGIDLWHDPDARPWATITIDAHQEHWPLSSGGFRRWLKKLFYDKVGKAPGSQGVQDAQGVLEGKALYDGDEHRIYTRLAEHDSAFYLDLADDWWHAVKVTDNGWEVITNPPVKFRRSRGMQALPQPVRGGDINQLRHFVNVASEDDWALLLAWLVAALRPAGPYPVMVLHGEQGSAKSTLARMLRSLVDPYSASLRSEPRDPRDLMIASNNGWVVNLDNLSRIPTWLSDCLCRLATGGGFATRELYTNDDEVLFDAQRPVIINGIEELATRGDLLDRAIILYLPSIPEDKRQPEKEFWFEFQKAQPHILGALLTIVSDALANIQHVKLKCLPRMADFALWGAAAEPALGLESGVFIEAYTSNRKSGNELTLDSSVLAQVLLKMEVGEKWEDTASNLLEKLNALVNEAMQRQKSWPKDGKRLSNTLRRLAPNLRETGIDVEFYRESHTRRRLITIRKSGECIVPAVPIVPSVRETVGMGDDDSLLGTQRSSSNDCIVPRNHFWGDDETDGDDEIPINSNDRSGFYPHGGQL